MISAELIEEFAHRLRPLLPATGEFALPEMPNTAEALVVWALSRVLGRSVLWVGESVQRMETMYCDLATLQSYAPSSIQHLLYYPARDLLTEPRSAPKHGQDPDPEITGQRFNTLLQLWTCRSDPTPRVLVTSIRALLQKTVSTSALLGRTFTLERGQGEDLEQVRNRLPASGYRCVAEVEEKGTFAIRGGILDLWPVTQPWPARVEWAGSCVETIRLFDPVTQRSVEKLDALTVPPAGEWVLLTEDRHSSSFLTSWLPSSALLVWSHPDEITEQAEEYEAGLREAQVDHFACSYSDLLKELGKMRDLRQVRIGDTESSADRVIPLDVRPLPVPLLTQEDIFSPDLLEQRRQQLLSELATRRRNGHRIFFFFDTQGSLEHFQRTHKRGQERGVTEVEWQLTVGVLSDGFVSDSMQLAVVAEPNLYGRRKLLGRRYDPGQRLRGTGERSLGERIATLTDIEPGDLVVHVEHGVGRYEGMFEIEVDGEKQEVLTIEYAEGARLHVPVAQAHLLTRYVGLPGHKVRLHRLGGRRWTAEKAAAERAILDLASSLLETQARRQMLEGHRFSPDTPWQHDFEAAFPYRETPDQQAVISEVKADMESPRPMDRLVCGDAGYGKTEVAMRVAFKAVMDGKQVAVLVPTTVLAQQHYETFTERMAGYPIRIAMLSRFCSPARRVATIKGLADGTIDIVIGTHALLEPDVRFKDLGLVVVDEEQRFGVRHKEQLKRVRLLVDVLTLTATPIPRTLYLSLTGAREMSLLQTPPLERMSIETIVVRDSDEVVRRAIVQELSRDGQVFFLYNRVLTIHLAAERVRRLVPEARVAVAHGQMPSSELSAVMHRFINGEFNVLVCTTIIESGVDIPRVNTIIIDRADRFGIADLYQLRGRVGRSNRKGYAYLLLPPHGYVDSDSKKRIAAVSQHTSPGAGFNLALRDLEIRGAGNLLGAEQSGHIAALGFGLYCQLLKRTIVRLKNEPLPPLVDVDVRLDFVSLSSAPDAADRAALIPYSYIEEESLRISAYRKLAECTSREEIAALRAEWCDRYGSPPAPVQRLLKIAELRVLAALQKITRIESREGKVMLTRNGSYITLDGRFPRLTSHAADEKLAELLRIVRNVDAWAFSGTHLTLQRRSRV